MQLQLSTHGFRVTNWRGIQTSEGTLPEGSLIKPDQFSPETIIGMLRLGQIEPLEASPASLPDDEDEDDDEGEAAPIIQKAVQVEPAKAPRRTRRRR